MKKNDTVRWILLCLVTILSVLIVVSCVLRNTIGRLIFFSLVSVLEVALLLQKDPSLGKRWIGLVFHFFKILFSTRRFILIWLVKKFNELSGNPVYSFVKEPEYNSGARMELNALDWVFLMLAAVILVLYIVEIVRLRKEENG